SCSNAKCCPYNRRDSCFEVFQKCVFMRLADPIHLAVAALMSLSFLAEPTHAAEPGDTSRGDQMLAAYFRSETQKLADASAARMKSWDNWTSHRDEYRKQLREMLGLDPLPERAPL